MKKLFGLVVVMMLIAFPVMCLAFEDRSAIYPIDLTTDGVMGSRNGTSTFLINGSSDPIDLTMYKPNFGVSGFSLQVYNITPGVSCAATNQGGTSPWQYSGVTYTIRYYSSNKLGIWSSGTTIMNAIALSGASTNVVNFAPEFAKYYKFDVMQGITQFSMKAILLIH